MEDKQNKDLYERIAFFELKSIKMDSDNFDTLKGSGIISPKGTFSDDKEDFTYGFTFEKIKETVLWLIINGYLKDSNIDITSTLITFHYGDQSPMTEKGIELYRKLSKKYNKEYFAEKARKKISENNNQNN